MKKKEASARIKINHLLEEAGWRFFDDENGPANIQLEPNVKMSKADLTGLGENFDKVKNGFVDFLLLDDKGKPFIVLEAKAEDKDPLVGKEQAREYAKSLYLKYVILSNGNQHYFWNIYYMKSSFDLKEILYVPAEAHLWYLYAMIPIYLVLPFFQIMCRHMDIKMEKLFFLVTTGWVLFNFLLWIMGGEAYYDLPVIGDRIYAWYLFAGYFIWKYRRHIRISRWSIRTGRA